ncbi:MAG: long-chain fatty acid--CoA ligase, partial [Bacteroidetes bacterium]
MKYPERLFDVIDFQLKNFPKQDMFAAKVNGVWEKHSTESVQKITTAFAAGLVKLGVSPNDFSDEGVDKIGIISNNRPEWMFTDLAVQQTGAVLVPIYPTTSEPEIQFILNDALVKYLFVANADLLAKIKRVAPYVPSLKGIYTFDVIAGEQHWTEVGKLADELSHQQLTQIKQQISKQHLATIIYTSGTTGTPKGVMLTHNNISANVVNSKAS